MRHSAARSRHNFGHSVSVLLHNPKFLDNLGRVARIASCYGVEAVWYSGERVSFDVERLPRELRMREYEATRPQRLFNYRRAICGAPGTPVAVELVPGAECLFDFEHPQDALYVIGPEDGSIPQDILRLCHRFVSIPTEHCLSMPVALATVLYDRALKAPSPETVPNRGGGR